MIKKLNKYVSIILIIVVVGAGYQVFSLYQKDFDDKLNFLKNNLKIYPQESSWETYKRYTDDHYINVQKKDWENFIQINKGIPTEYKTNHVFYDKDYKVIYVSVGAPGIIRIWAYHHYDIDNFMIWIKSFTSES